MRLLILHPRWVFLLLLMVAALGCGGCASPELDNRSERPWDTPQGWETGLPSSLYDRH
jgi:hypothetical protein